MKLNINSIVTIILSAYKTGFIPVIYGQTATGKTRLSLELAKKFKEDLGKEIEVISADSRQVYRYMDIGTDKIGQDIRNQVIHHMIDIINPDEIYTAGQRQQDVYIIVDEIISRGNIPVIVGGTGLYIDSIVYHFNMGLVEPDMEYRAHLEDKAISYEEPLIDSDEAKKVTKTQELNEKKAGMLKKDGNQILRNMLDEVDPVEAAKHHPSSTRFIIRALEIYKQTGIRKSELMVRQKPKYPLLMIGLEQDREIGNEMIDKRLEMMINQGLIQEVKSLMEMGYGSQLNSMKTIDYKQTVEYINTTILLNHSADFPEDENVVTHKHTSTKAYIESLQIANHQLAKKQRTWFRRYKRDSDACDGFDKENQIQYLQFYLPDYQ